jgi:hypothetical protein
MLVSVVLSVVLSAERPGAAADTRREADTGGEQGHGEGGDDRRRIGSAY